MTAISIVQALAELKTASTTKLREKWRELYATEPPLYNRKFLESRLAYRIQELALWRSEPRNS